MADNSIRKKSGHKKAYFVFGRFQPPHAGHAELIERLYTLAHADGADPYVFPSSTHDAKTNPLTIDQKVRWLKMMFPATSYPGLKIINTTRMHCTTILKAVDILKAAGYEEISIFAGTDRIPGFAKMLKDTGVTIIEKPRGAGAISGTKMREIALEGDFDSFFENVHKGNMTEDLAHEMMTEILLGLIPESTKAASAAPRKSRSKKASSASAAAIANNNNNNDMKGGGKRTRKNKRKSRCRA
jgi:hypothetical protein